MVPEFNDAPKAIFDNVLRRAYKYSHGLLPWFIREVTLVEEKISPHNCLPKKIHENKPRIFFSLDDCVVLKVSSVRPEFRYARSVIGDIFPRLTGGKKRSLLASHKWLGRYIALSI